MQVRLILLIRCTVYWIRGGVVAAMGIYQESYIINFNIYILYISTTYLRLPKNKVLSSSIKLIDWLSNFINIILPLTSGIRKLNLVKCLNTNCLCEWIKLGGWILPFNPYGARMPLGILGFGQTASVLFFLVKMTTHQTWPPWPPPWFMYFNCISYITTGTVFEIRNIRVGLGGGG